MNLSDQVSKSRKKSCTISRFVHDKIFSCTIFFVHDFLRLKWNSIHLFTENGNWWTQMVNESDVKSPKRLHLVQLLNKGNDYHPFYSIFQRNIAFQVARFSHDFNFLHDFFRARIVHESCTKNILAMHEIVHDRTIRYFSWFRTLF